MAGFEFPEKAKTLAMPAEERLGFEDEERFFPIFEATSEEDEPEAIGLRNRRLFDLTVKDEQLLTQKCVLSDEVSCATREICDGAPYNGKVE